MTAHSSLAAKPQTRVYEVMLAQWITSTARAAAGKAQHTATPVRGVVGRRLALQRHLEAGAVILQASATLAQAAARGRAARAKAMGMRIRDLGPQAEAEVKAVATSSEAARSYHGSQ